MSHQMRNYDQSAGALGEKCQATGKRSYLSRAGAKEGLSKMRAAGVATKDLRPYKCECGHFHIGTYRIHGQCESRSVHREIHESKFQHEGNTG